MNQSELENPTGSYSVQTEEQQIAYLKQANSSLQLRLSKLVEFAGNKERETTRWAWVATGSSLVSIILLIFGIWHNMSRTPAAHPSVVEVAASAPPAAKPSAPATGTPATLKLPAPAKGPPPATLPDTETCEEILRPGNFPEGVGKYGAVCGEAVYRIDSSVKEDGRFVHTNLVLLPDVVPP